jgi:RNA polymerase sigma-70 factor (ECF subfamily)
MEISLASYIEGATVRRTSEEIDLLLRDVRPWLYRLALAITTRPDVAEDVAQEALIRASRSRQKLMAVDEPRAWLRTIVVRCALTAISKTPVESPVSQRISADPTDRLAVQQVLSRLETAERVILALVHFEGLSYAEIADALEIPVGTVASRLHNAREAFRAEWRK